MNVVDSSRRAGSAAEEAEKRKKAKYVHIGQQFSFYPVGLETFGPWGPSTELFETLKGTPRESILGDITPILENPEARSANYCLLDGVANSLPTKGRRMRLSVKLNMTAGVINDMHDMTLPMVIASNGKGILKINEPIG
ncbi:hypothetical protein RvY_15668 [Ramazzottius varieornatus]|uniref:Uncharacterized protein n=1 Tax=Ramazzottius varieornatus TaxID=947166 RepID=A0A1D1VVS3_RAMVA|nr:hypothetical protein RvY_15668 [Ramazzottius varieornatus]